VKVLVTGAGGFIGRCVSGKMEEEGHQVIRVLRPAGNPAASDRASVLELDLTEPGIIPRSLNDRIDVVVHLAAMIPSGFDSSDATEAAALNRRIDGNVFNASRDLNAAVVYASSSSVYGLGDGEVKTETSPTAPLSPYALAKLDSEKMGEQLFLERGLPFTILRINAPYGALQRTRTVMKVFIERALQDLPIHYHGSGSRQQDFTYVEDVASAISKAARVAVGGLYNISGGCPISMRALAELVVSCLPGCKSRVETSGENDPQEGATALYSIQRAKECFGWESQVPLETGIKICAARWVS
jgi:UDP-glucose 4-epimerase